MATGFGVLVDDEDHRHVFFSKGRVQLRDRKQLAEQNFDMRRGSSENGLQNALLHYVDRLEIQR